MYACVSQSNSLPPFTQSYIPCFKWGDIDGASYRNAINDAYSEVVYACVRVCVLA